MRLNDLIDWFRGWCPRETLLGKPSLLKASFNMKFLGSILRERPVEVALTIVILSSGLGGYVIPKTYLPAIARVWILTGSDLEVDYCTGGIDRQITTAIITPPYRGGEVPYVVIEISDGNTVTETEGILVATAFMSLPDRNITVIGDAHIGYEAYPDWRKSDVDMVRGGLSYNVYLCKDGLERVIGQGGGSTLEHFKVNLLSLEEAESVQPPYNITSRGFIAHKLESNIDGYYSEHRLTFWSLCVEEGGIIVTQFADLPREELLVINPWLKILQEWRLPLTTIGIIAVVLLYRTSRSSFNRVAKT